MCAQRAQFSSTTRRHEVHSSIGRHKKKKNLNFRSVSPKDCSGQMPVQTGATGGKNQRNERKKNTALYSLFFFSFFHPYSHHTIDITNITNNGPVQSILLSAQPPCRQAWQAVRTSQTGTFFFHSHFTLPLILQGARTRKVIILPSDVPCLAWMNNSDHAPCLFYWPIRYLYPHRQLSLAPLRHTRYDSLLHRRVCQRPYPYHCMTATSMIAFSHNAKPDPQPASHRNADKKRIQQGDNTNRLTTCQESDLSGYLILTEQCQQQQNPSLSLSSVTLSISFYISLSIDCSNIRVTTCSFLN